MYHSPKYFYINLEIIMYKNMPHFFNESPRHVLMGLFKFSRKFIYCLANDLNIIYSGVQTQFIQAKCLKLIFADKLFYMFYCFDYMLQSSSISNLFSHKPIFYHVLQIHGQKVTNLHQLQGQRVVSVFSQGQ